jgi:hypothetical protein
MPDLQFYQELDRINAPLTFPFMRPAIVNAQPQTADGCEHRDYDGEILEC